MKKFKCFNKRDMDQKNANFEPNSLQQEMIWEQKVEETMKLGYSYEVAYAIVSKIRIKDLFERDIKIEC